jgi:hypothetical protein
MTESSKSFTESGVLPRRKKIYIEGNPGPVPPSLLGFSDFHNVIGFTSSKMPNSILYNVSKQVVQLVKPLFANFHCTRSQKYLYMYSMTPKNFYIFFAYEYQKYAVFYADFKPVEIIGRKCTQKTLFANFRNHGKILACFDTHIQIL